MTRKWIAAVLCALLLLSLAGQAAAERLQYGSAGPKVLALQQKLAALSFYDDVLDGKYGYKTYLAVKKFQESAGLQADGIAGPKTLEMIGLAAPPLSAEVYQAGDTGGRISEIRTPERPGHLTGSETGIFDEDTLKAVLAFQKTNALPETALWTAWCWPDGLCRRPWEVHRELAGRAVHPPPAAV